MKNYFQEFKKKRMFMPVILISLTVIVLVFVFAVPWEVRIVDVQDSAMMTTLTFADLTENVDLPDVSNLRLNLKDSPTPVEINIYSEYTYAWKTIIEIRDVLDISTPVISKVTIDDPVDLLIIECTNYSSGDFIYVGFHLGKHRVERGDVEVISGDRHSPLIHSAVYYLNRGDDNILIGSLLSGIGFIRIIADDGNDRIDFGDAHSTTNHIFGGNGNDYIKASASVENLIYGGNGNDQLTSEGVYDTTIHRLYGDAGDDEISLDLPYSGITTTERHASLYGGRGDDRLNGSHLPENLHGGDGNDTINAGPGNDRCNGDRGNDVIHGDDGNDEINCGDGYDWGFGGNGNDIMRGNNGNDTLMGEDGDDRIYGNSGNDHLIGGPGRDMLLGGPGSDTLISD